MKRKLNINLIPETSFYNNLRSLFPKEEWDLIRRECYKKANYVCEICGENGLEQGYNWPVECHELWDFSKRGIQKLIRLIALCPLCHKCQHLGFAQIEGTYDIAKAHYILVNKITKKEADHDIYLAFEKWTEDSQITWDLDLTLLDKSHV